MFISSSLNNKHPVILNIFQKPLIRDYQFKIENVTQKYLLKVASPSR